MTKAIPVVINGVQMEVTVEQYIELGRLGLIGSAKPSASGRGSATPTTQRVKLTAEEREAKKQEKNAQHKAEQKAWFDNLSETEKQEFIAKKEEQRKKRTYMDAIKASRLNVQMVIDKKYKGERVPTETYNTLFKAEMKKYGFDWTPKSK